MLEGQDNPKLTEAKEAVKQQLLRAIVKQATEELYALDDDQMLEKLEAVASTTECDQVCIKVRDRLSKRIAKQVADGLPTDEEAWISVAEKAIEKSEMIDSAVAKGLEITTGKVEEQIIKLVAAKEPSVDDIYDRISSKIDVQAEWVDDLAKKIEARWQGRLTSDVAARIKKGIESNEDLTAQTISILLKDDSIFNSTRSSILDGLASSMAEKAIVSMVDSDDLLRATEKHLDLDSKEFGQAIHATREMLAGLVAEHAMAGATRSDAFLSTAASRLSNDSKEYNELLSSVNLVLARKVADKAIERATHSEEFIDAASQKIDESEEALTGILEKTRAEIMRRVAEATVTTLDDVDTIASEARAYIPFDNDTLIAATALLRSRVIQDLARRTTHSLTDEVALSEEATAWIDGEDPFIQQAAAVVQKTALTTVSALVRQSLADVDLVASRVAPEFNAENIQVRNAVEATRKQIVAKVTQYVVDRLRDTDSIAKETVSAIPSDHESIQAAVEATEALLVEEVARFTSRKMKNVKKISVRARQNMNRKIPEVVQAADVLENILLSEVASEATQRLYDLERASNKARSYIDEDDARVSKIEAHLSESLLKGIADGALTKLEDVDRIAEEARARITDRHKYVLQAIDSLRLDLIRTIADGATDSIEDSEAVARESRHHIDPDHIHIKKATGRLRDLVIQDIIGSSMRTFADADDAAIVALDRIDPDNDIMDRARIVLRERMTEQLLHEALKELAGVVDAPGLESDRLFFQRALSLLTSRVDQVHEKEDSESKLEQECDSVDTEECESPPRMILIHPDEIPETPDRMTDENPPTLHTSNCEWTSLADMNHSEDLPESTRWTDGQQSSPEFKEMSGDGAGFDSVPEAPQVRKVSPSTVYYLYGMLAYDVPLDLTRVQTSGIDGQADVSLLIDGKIAAIVSEVDSATFGTPALQMNMKSNSWLKEHVRRHAAVLSDLKQNATVVPLKFGTVCTSEDAVYELMGSQGERYERAFTRLFDKKEFGLRVLCQVELLTKQISTTDYSFDRSLEQISRGMANYLKSEMKGKDSDSERSSVEAILDNCVRRSHVTLLELASEGVFKPVVESTDDLGRTLVMSAAYLVPSPVESQFKDAIEKLADEFGEMGFSFEQSGPWPPYHFVDIDDSDTMAGAA